MFRHILVVCIGNICRSPMGEGVFKHAFLKAGKPEIEVSSAGLGALIGHPPDPFACQLMLEKGIDISGYRATQINSDIIRKSDLILVMENKHKLAIEDMEPSAKGKVFRLGEWGKYDISDPYRKELDVFESSLNLIEHGASEWIKRL